MNEEVHTFYEKALLDTFMQGTNISDKLLGEIIGYRKVKVPRYLTIKIPTISRMYDDDSEYGTGEYVGLLIAFKEVSLFRIGTEIELRPIRKRIKPSAITFRRISGLEVFNL